MSPAVPWRTWGPDAAVALGVLLLGLVEVAAQGMSPAYAVPAVLVLLVLAASVGLSRHLPGAALALVWAGCLLQLVSGTGLLLVQVAVVVVAFGTARWGGPVTLLASVLSIPVAAVIAVAWLRRAGLGGDLLGSGVLTDAAYRLGTASRLGAVVLGMSLLGVPWLAGLVLRFMDRATTSRASQTVAEDEAERAHRETEQAQEIARLREQQTRLARDVHDVVGHSLAVILAQAESAQYLPDVDTAALKQTMSTIATSARSSLQDVRAVLTAPHPGQDGPGRTGGLTALIAGVRASGHQVHDTEVGAPQPLPPELETVAYRVLQEMLTNAIRHGRRDTPVTVERHWPDGRWQHELRLEVRNAVPVDPERVEEERVEEETVSDDTQPLAAAPDDWSAWSPDRSTAPSTRTTAAEAAPASPSFAPTNDRPEDRAGQGVEGMRTRLESVGGRLDVRLREEADGPTFTTTAWVPVRPDAR